MKIASKITKQITENGKTDAAPERERAIYAGGISFFILITIVHLFWALSGPLTKLGYAGLGISGEDILPVIHFAGLRLLISGAIGLVYCSVRGMRLLPADLAELWQLTKLGLLMGVAQYLFFNFGAAFSSGVQVSLVSGSGAFWGILISALVFKGEDSLSARKLLGGLLGIAAVVILNWDSMGTGAAASLFGALLLLLGQISGSFGAAYLKLIARDRNAVWVGGWQSVISGGILVLIGLAGMGPFDFSSGGGWLAPALVMAATSGAALILSNQLYKYNALSKVMIFSLLSPIFGVLCSAVLLGESLRSGFVLASLLVNCLGIALVVFGDKTAADPAPKR